MPGIKRNLIRQQQIGSFLFDGGSQLYLLNPLNEDTTILQGRTREGQEHRLTFRKTRQVLYTEGTFLQVMNLVVRNAMQELKLQLVGRDFFDAEAAIDIRQHRIQIWPGYLTSIRQHETEILMNCKLAHKVMRQENVLQIITDCMQQPGNFQDTAAKKIIGSTVLTDYNNETYKVDDIDWLQNPDSTFETRDGEESFAAYYERRYRIQIKDRRQPLLVVKPKARNIRGGQDRLILLVPELCRATGVTDQMRSNFQLMRDMAQYTRLSPRENVERLNTFNRRLQENQGAQRIFKENYMRLDNQLVELKGRRLKQETVYFGNDRNVDLRDANADWTRNLQNNMMFRTMPLKNWYYLYPRRSEQTAREFYGVFKQVTDGFRMRVEAPVEMAIEDNTRAYAEALESIMRKDPQFIMVVVSSNAADRYAAIKRITLCTPDSVTPVAVQVIAERTMKPKKGSVMSIATKVVIQVNCKLGGIPWNVNLKLKGLLIIGFDISHDTRDRRKSYGAMVASLNPSGEHGGHYFSTVNQHENGEQISNYFGLNIIEAIKQYSFLNSPPGETVLPDRILIYRDGVGDGQIQYVYEKELKAVISNVQRMYDNFNAGYKNPQDHKHPKIGFVIVNKRTNARFVTSSGRNGFDNPAPGTIVDDTITMPERYDFYMVPQLVRQGTVSPTYYNVIHDDFYSKRPEIMQAMTFKLCHLYFNWSGTTRIPSVVQYAKKLAFLVGQFTHEAPSLNIPIQNQLYFL